MKLSTRALAAASARHPWRTIGAWIGAFVTTTALIGVLLGGSLTTEGAPTNNPESTRAHDALMRAFRPEAGTLVTDIVIVRSERYTVDAPEFEAFVGGLVADGGPALGRARTYLSVDDESLLSADRRAAILAVDVFDDEITGVLDAVERADEDEAFAVEVTGEQTLDHDFNKLSQDDLKSGELQFGLPAALIILLLVFGAVVAGLIPLLTAIVSIVVALGLVAVLAQATELSVF
ncbi:MAG TPA: MMPL family transporter, partial [Gaiellaceae bacterium]|nr:MMPL family transporter [Gaiellaceae bacterium]